MRLALAVLALLACAAAPARAQDPHEIKAEMLWKIAKFVDWPDKAFSRSGQLVVSILGEDELAAVLATSLSSKTVNGRQVFVRFIRRAQDAQGAQILYVASSETARVPEILRALEGTSALTVSDVSTFVAQGGMVGFGRDADRQKFEINPGRAHRAGLKISARLLALARVVDDAAAGETSARTP